jgi:hypothetical protein
MRRGSRSRASLRYLGEVPPELGCSWGGATPPLRGSGPPAEFPLPPLLPPPPVLGVEGGVYEGVPVPPPDGVPEGVAGVPVLGVAPAPPLEVPLFASFFLLALAGVTGLPVEIGGGGDWNVSELEPEPPPPLAATAITTIMKKATPASATSLRRR